MASLRAAIDWDRRPDFPARQSQNIGPYDEPALVVAHDSGDDSTQLAAAHHDLLNSLTLRC
jgi:hypothetical protein